MENSKRSKKNRHHFTASTIYEPQHSFRMLFSQPAGHGPLHTDEKHTVINPRAKSGDNNMHRLLQLPGIGGGEIRGERLSDISSLATIKARQRTVVIRSSSHSNRHFHKAQVQLQQLCHRPFNSLSSQLQGIGNTS